MEDLKYLLFSMFILLFIICIFVIEIASLLRKR